MEGSKEMDKPGAEIDADAVHAALRTVVDPEVGVNIVDLGLIYRVAVEAERVTVDMTMTSPACPMGEMLVDEVEAALKKALPKGWEYAIEMVWEPAWSPARMSAAAKAELGWDE